MDMDRYQVEAGRTARYPSTTEMPTTLIYCALKLAGEAGEFAEKIGKLIRDTQGTISPTARASLEHELGDVLWYVARCAHELGIPLNMVAQANLDKLNSRATRNMIHGSGDNR